jgi:hypothetical protein
MQSANAAETASQQGNSLKQAKSLGREFLKVIKRSPIVTLDQIRSKVHRPSRFTRLCPEREYESYRDKAVHPTTAVEFYLDESKVNYERVKEGRSFFDRVRFSSYHTNSGLNDFGTAAALERFANGPELNDAIGPAKSDEYRQYKNWMDLPLNRYLGLHGNAIFTVDLGAPDNLLIEQFMKEVRTLRDSSSLVKRPTLDRDEWAECCLLPYIDIRIWHHIDGLLNGTYNQPPIPDAIMQRLLFPKSGRKYADRSGTQKARTVTRKHYLQMMSLDSSFFRALNAEAAALEDIQYLLDD